MHPFLTRIALLLYTALPVCTTLAQVADDRPPAMAPVMNDPVQGGWQAADLEKQVHQWEQLVGTADAGAQQLVLMNLFRSERNAALARNNGSITNSDQQRLQQLAQELERQAPNSFEAHMARYYLEFPDPGAFMHLARARAKDPSRAELLGPLLCNAARSGIKDELERHANAFKARGATDPALWKVADDILLSVDQGGILFTAGDMDAHPLLARQYADRKRQDVLVVDVRLLADPAYRLRIWYMAQARGPVPAYPDAFMAALPTATTRPVHYSLALGRDAVREQRAKLYLTGMAFRYSATPFDNLPLLEQRWERMHKETGGGPLSRNYLLPGSVLLQHHRSMGNEEAASMLEHQLRQMARSMGATPALYTLGVLEH